MRVKRLLLAAAMAGGALGCGPPNKPVVPPPQQPTAPRPDPAPPVTNPGR
jgi:hypothetical protein